MNVEYRLELLEAFAASKPSEFHGFKSRWLRTHPEPPEPVEEPVVEAVVESLPLPMPEIEVEVAEEKPAPKKRKPKPKRKKMKVDAGA